MAETQFLSIMESIQFTIKNEPYISALNLSKLYGKVVSTKFVLANIAQLKVKSKVHTQNHSSGVNMKQMQSIT